MPANRGSGHARAVEHRGVERNRIQQIFAPHHFDQKRLPRRHVECVHRAQQRRERNDFPHADASGERQRRQRERQHHRRRLRRDHHALARPPVGHESRQRREQKNGNLAHEAEHAEQHRRSRQPVNQPRLRDRLHPRADQRNNLSAEKKLEISMLQRAENRGGPALPGWSRRQICRGLRINRSWNKVSHRSQYSTTQHETARHKTILVSQDRHSHGIRDNRGSRASEFAVVKHCRSKTAEGARSSVKRQFHCVQGGRSVRCSSRKVLIGEPG